ncbi:uncharacterized protein LOC128557990 [Mercenaria mercenaria]|uniref:uncharacterized protein LOC128557990 n=1 Tax=Mercenaria mercenaria TaxID=6596 RepID=UPI00234E8BF5|nr:uncharacterized protein LOC128557990 [Mercenaria mercenaria]
MNLQKLQSQREGHKRVIRNYITKIEDAKERSALIEFDAILQSLESKIKVTETLNVKILSQTDVEGIEEEIVKAEEFSLDIEINLRQLRAFHDDQGELRTERHPPPQHPQDNQPHFSEVDNVTPANQGSQINNQSVSNISPNSQYHRLAKLSLPTFSGNILEWQTFWDSFESTIHYNVNLTDVQKFSYLKSQLEHTAARVIDGFAMTNANYTRAIDLLKERFGQQHKITHATMQTLLQLPAPSNTLYSLRHFHDKMETYIRGLESLGLFQETYGSLLVPIIIDKLPDEMRKHIAREHGDNNWQLDELRRAINKEINIMEAGDSLSTANVDEFGPTASFYTGARPKKNKSNIIKQVNFNHVHKNPIRCAFCEESHSSLECQKFSDVNARMRIVKQRRLCFNCLGKHQVSMCHSKHRCRYCQKKHHSSICNKQTVTSLNNSTPEVHETEPEAPVLHSSSRHTSSGVLLKTAVATVNSMDTYMDANILFDEEAQRSFITEDLAQKLHVRRESTEALKVSSFGSTSNKIQYLDCATVYLVADSHQKIPIRVLIVPTIATPISNRAHYAASKLPYLQGLKLAHTVTDDSPFSISMLIGADFYWDVIEDHIIRGNGPTAVKSKVGYLLSGPIIEADKREHIDHIFNVITSHRAEESDLERFWSLESKGITTDPVDQKLTAYLEQYQQTSIEFTDGRYSAKLPWKEDHPPLPTNYEIARKRTENTIRRLSSQPHILKKYGDIITDQEQRGFIEKIDNSADTPSQVHYIPHHPVKKDSPTTPSDRI